MGKRNYNQFCPVAYSLDLIGDRWTLLIIRELMFGVRRYKDFQSALTGIGTNLLATRLKELEQSGLINHFQLPPPAGSMVYELSERGRALKKPLLDLARWGLPLLPIPRPESEQINASAILTAMELFFLPEKARDALLTAEFHTREDVFYIVVEDGEIALGYGVAHQPDLVIHSNLQYLLMLTCGFASIDHGADTNPLVLEQGRLEDVQKLFQLFQFQTFNQLA